MTFLRVTGMAAAVALLAGCAANVDRLDGLTPTGDAFTQQLALEYRDFAEFEAFEMRDWGDADHFAAKALRAADGEVVLPEELGDWDIDEAFIPELSQARADLLAALDGNARLSFPVDAAIAQARFDCWVEQQEENIQPDHIAACRDEFFVAFEELVAMMVPPAPAPEPMAPEMIGPIFVFFDWDSDVLTPMAMDTLASVVGQYAAGVYDSVMITGHADTSGPADYNVGLSLRRAASVATALSDMGVPAGIMMTDGLGETELLVPTPDGVREPSNRRAEIVIQ